MGEHEKRLTRELDAQRVYARVLCRAGDAATDFAGTVAGGASWWDDVWAEHESALDAARSAISDAANPESIRALLSDLDASRAEVERLTRELVETRAEIERLRREKGHPR